MNGKLIFALSMFGLAMGVGTVFVIPSQIEPLIWLVIFVICAILIARREPAKPFVHGLLTGLLNSVWITGAHVLLYDAYIANHAREAAMMANAPLSPQVMMLITGPVVGLVSGIVLGIFAIIATKVMKTSKPGAATPTSG